MARGLLRCLVGLAAAAAVAATVPLTAQSRLNVRLATLAPDNSPWASALKSMGAAWQKATANRVRLVVFAGTIPSESSAITQMAVDTLQAATLTAAGLAEIDEAFNVFGIPFFFQSDEELAHVQEQLQPMLAARLEARKFRFIGWGNAGWVQLFSKEPVRNLADLRNVKLYTGESSPKMVQWYTANGFHVVPLAAGEIPKQLKLPTGAINAAPSPPVLALTMQFFRDAPYMLDIRVAPLTSATIMTESAWNRVSAQDRPRLLQAAQAAEARIRADAPGLDAKAIKEMQGAGLEVITPDPTNLRGFMMAADILLSTLRGNMVPADVYDAAVKARDSFRVAK